MMHYVLDTGFFVQSREYYPEVFPSFWDNLTKSCQDSQVSSVHEVFQEVENYAGNQEHVLEWIRSKKEIFTKPTAAEQEEVRAILANSRYVCLVDKKALLDGKPAADPWVIAKAKATPHGAVVTREKKAKRDKNGNIQGSYKMPDVCQELGVHCLTILEFMEEMGWRF